MNDFLVLTVSIVIAYGLLLWSEWDRFTQRRRMEERFVTVAFRLAALESHQGVEPPPMIATAPTATELSAAEGPPEHIHQPYVYRVDADGTEHEACRLCSEPLD